MLKKFTIDYTLFPHHNDRLLTHRTDDPVEAEDFLAHLLASGARISSIRHDGEELAPHQFDRMVRIAAESLVVRLLGDSLDLDSAAIRHRFHLAA
jgi:hypothetical protein